MKKIILLLIMPLMLLALSSCSSEPPVHTVTFNTKTEDKVEAQAVIDGKCAKEPEVSFIRAGFAFDGWTLDGDNYDFSTPVTKDIVLVAEWNVYCTVSFHDTDGGDEGICTAQEIEYMHTASEPDVPTKPGYTFAYWIAPDKSRYNFQRPVTRSMELTASWIPNKYTVTYNDNDATTVEDGALPEGTTYTYGENFDVEGITTSKLSKTGYVFEGWTLEPGNKDAKVYTPGESAKGEPQDMVLYAKWTEKKYQTGYTGPSGGIIVAVNSDTDGEWKYIEAAPDALRSLYPYGYLRSGVTTNISAGTTEGLGDGKNNTERLVRLLGETAPVEEGSITETVTDDNGTYTHTYNKKGTYAARACYDYSMEKESVTYDDWYLPSKDEMAAFYDAFSLSQREGKGVDTGEYVTSSETSATECTTFLYVTQPVDQLPGTYRRYSGAQTAEKSKTFPVWPVRYI